jgi:predicted GNAT family N-acyltransferase
MIKYEVTRDPELLRQYYELRERCFREDLGIEDFDGSEDEKDKQAHILIAHKNGRCVGGVRISLELPTEESISDLSVDMRASCSWERFVFHPDERSTRFSREFLANLIDVCHALDFKHAFVLSSLRNARFYRLFHTALGIPFEILKAAPEFAQGKFTGLEHYLSVSHLQEVQELRLVA